MMAAMRPRHWLPPALWMVLIFALGSDAASAEQTSRLVRPVLNWLLPGVSPFHVDVLHGVLRKLAHFTEYAVLAGLWFRALSSGLRWRAWTVAAAALAISAGWAVVDEAHQWFTPSRTASLADVALDTAGALAAVLAAAPGWWRTVEGLTTIVLWAGALGGGAILVINLLIGVPSGVLWLTAPAAALVLIVRRRARRPLRP
jgi:VanZ family protein